MTTNVDGHHLPDVDGQLVERIARTLLPHVFTQAGRPLTGASSVEVQEEVRWWVRSSIAWAEHLGGIRHGTVAGDDVAGDTLTLIREALAEKGLWEAVAVVTALEAKDDAGRPLVEPPTGQLPAVVADPLAARRAAREWRTER